MEIDITIVEWLLGATVAITSYLVSSLSKLGMRTATLEKQMDQHIAECKENKATLDKISRNVAFIRGELTQASCLHDDAEVD